MVKNQLANAGEVKDEGSISVLRIFYRNAINIGLPIMECPEAAEGISAGDALDVDFESGRITDLTSEKEYQAEAFPDFIREIIKDGGLANHIRKQQEK